jgi:hypothetical protein
MVKAKKYASCGRKYTCFMLHSGKFYFYAFKVSVKPFAHFTYVDLWRLATIRLISGGFIVNACDIASVKRVFGFFSCSHFVFPVIGYEYVV